MTKRRVIIVVLTAFLLLGFHTALNPPKPKPVPRYLINTHVCNADRGVQNVVRVITVASGSVYSVTCNDGAVMTTGDK